MGRINKNDVQVLGGRGGKRKTGKHLRGGKCTWRVEHVFFVRVAGWMGKENS